ncbi:hypothetical protein LCGC14_1733060, partial [marine sediment metagenome]
ILGLGSIGQYNVVDLAPYLVDASAIGVVVRMTHNGTSNPNSVTEAAALGAQHGCRLQPDLYINAAVSLGTGTTVAFRVGSTNVRAFLVGEIHGDDGAVLYPDSAYYQPAVEDYGFWVDHQPTPQGADTLDDIAAVIVRVLSQWSPTMGVRQKGSSSAPHALRWNGAMTWFVVGVDEDGYYQTYSTGKAGQPTEFSAFYEVGYIKHGSDVVTVLDRQAEGLATQIGSFATLNLAGSVPTGSTVVGGHWYNDTLGSDEQAMYLRNSGSSESTGIKIKVTAQNAQFVALDGNLEAEYQLQVATADFYIDWYEKAHARFLFDINTQPPFVASVLPTLPLESGANAKSPLVSAPAEATTALDAAAEVETPFGAEVDSRDKDS